MIGVDVISSGSKGNATVIGGSILMDCGVPFRALEGVYKPLQLVLLTHIHGDHFNRSTIRRLAGERPALRFGCCDWLAAPLINDCGVNPSCVDVYEPDGREYSYINFAQISAFPLTHNVPNCGYKIALEGSRIVYATDTNSMDGIEARDYDIYLIEANYTEAEIVERIREKNARGIYVHEYDALKNHLSREKADDWLYRNMRPKSRYIYMHQHEGGRNEQSDSNRQSDPDAGS